MASLDPSTLAALKRARYVSLTTYRKDGTPRATPVWHAVEGDRIYVRSAADAWKVKRLRRDSRAEVTVCDVRGRVAPDAVHATGTGRVLDDEEETRKAGALLRQKYVMARIGDWYSAISGRHRRHPVIGLEITF
ncbi:PPOX class F420-dependent oxidoreductase [Streptomyces endophyticus]|uniref:PPOX class F420-dependent oxidoreductase n=1 Tax=Streptomyces endophyticus TaxID=714166 RepID=A0ABU6F9T6_9ACTN|nr:PPOX class F420-dependent oxidoreductase [Streptomyces endophyticus]MEB8340805.1 PPOX class F420-dependent oxidoreductase [Streptomyces endophyticus]